MHHAHPKLKFIPPKFNYLILKITHLLLPLILRFRVRRWLVGGIIKIEVKNGEILANLYQKFFNQEVRLLIAFRHPEVEDPLSIIYLFSRTIPKIAHQQNWQLKAPIHSHFIYDRGMTIWAGKWLGWLFSQGGGFPIHRGKPLDRTALKTARELLVNGQFPMIIAPEGATNGHSEIVSPLEPGIARLSLWCVEDLLKANRLEQVYIVPVTIRYYFLTPPWRNIEKLLTKLEENIGLISDHFLKDSLDFEILYQRLIKLSEHLITIMEQFYQRFYHCQFPQFEESSEEILLTRLHNLLDLALTVAEDYFHLEKQGSFIDRCRRLEEVGWNYIYREDIDSWKSVSPVVRGLADWVAEEADLRLKNMRLVESFVAVSDSYIKEKPSAERFAEVTLILFDVVERIKGKKIPKRPRLGKRRVQVTIGDPLAINHHFPVYKSDRQSAKMVVDLITKDLERAFSDLINQS
jgi:1-acyl-sn-glycerol-3-phosphate acyltransferase